MSGFPNLHPSGFIEFQEPCSGVRLYRDQPSRESGGVTLNNFMSKYNPSSKVTDYKFLETVRNLKEFSRHWPNIPVHTRAEIVKMLKESNNELAGELKAEEHFTSHLKHAKDPKDAKKIINDMIEHFTAETGTGSDLTCVNSSHQIWMMVIVSIVSIVIAFLIFMAGAQ